jgi:hypothetical protein
MPTRKFLGAEPAHPIGRAPLPVAAGEAVWEDLPAEVRLGFTPAARNESQSRSSASLFPDDGLPPHEKRILSLLKAGEAAPIDGVIEARKRGSLPWECFAARFEREASKQDPLNAGEEFCKELMSYGRSEASPEQPNRARANGVKNHKEPIGRKKSHKMRMAVFP